MRVGVWECASLEARPCSLSAGKGHGSPGEKTTQSRLQDRDLLPGSAEVGTVSIIPGRTSADAYLRPTW